MKGSVKIARIAGVPLRVHWSFSLLVVYVLVGSASQSTSAVFGLLGWVAALFASVTVHELAHCVVAKRRGLKVRDIVLLPIGGVSEIEGMPSTPEIELKVAIVGPLTSLLLGGVLALVTVAVGGHLWPPSISFTGGHFLAVLAWVNVFLAAFNLIPALPMDGGRVLRALIATRKDPVKATRIATVVAYGFGAAMIAVGLAVDVWLILIGAFVIMGATAERRAATLRETFHGIRVGDVMVHEPVPVQLSLPVGQFAQWLAAYPGRAMPVVDGEGGPFIGIVAMRHLVGAHPWATVGDVCDREARTIDAAAPLVPDALEIFGSAQRPELAVTWQGQVIGVLYVSTVQGMLSSNAGQQGRASQAPGTSRVA